MGTAPEPSVPESSVRSARRPDWVRAFGELPFAADADVLAVRFAPDGRLWSVEDGGTLRRWDEAGRPDATWLLDDPAPLWCFGGDARLLAAGRDVLVLWELPDVRPLARIALPSWVTALAVRSFPPLLATGHDDGGVLLWDVLGRRLLRALRHHGRAVSALAFSPEGERLASAGEERDVCLWDVDSGRLRAALAGQTDRIPALAWHPQGQALVSAGWDGTAWVWDAVARRPARRLRRHAGPVTALAFSADGGRLATAGAEVRLWDARRFRHRGALARSGGPVRGLDFGPRGLLAAGGEGRGLFVVPTECAHGGQEVEVGGQGADKDGSSFTAADHGPWSASKAAVSVSPAGDQLVVASGRAPAVVRDAGDGTGAVELEGAGALWAAAYAPDGRRVAGGGDGLALWDGTTGRRLRALDGPAAPVGAVAFSRDGTLLAAAGHGDGDVWLWDADSGEPAPRVADATAGGAVEAVAFHPGRPWLAVAGIDRLATGGGDGAVALWDVRENRRRALFRGGALAVAFDPSGRRLAAATLRQTVRVWEVPTGRFVAELEGHAGEVRAVAYSPDGRLLASAGDDRAVHLWDADDGGLLAVTELDTPPLALAFAPDGRHLFTANANGSCFRLPVGRMLEETVISP